MDANTVRIRALNDELRQHLTGGTAVMTPGVAALGLDAVERIFKTIAVFDDFCHANDPHQEHDFGSFDADGHTIMFKINYYDKALSGHILPTHRTHPSPSGSSPSCWPRSIDGLSPALDRVWLEFSAPNPGWEERRAMKASRFSDAQKEFISTNRKWAS
jgi:hypothetical protein